MRLIVLILLATLLFVSQINTIIDVDLWWNLKAGEYIITNLDVPRVDIFSYTLKGSPWIDHEWLSQVLFYLVFSGFGWIGLNILKALTVTLCFLILFFLVTAGYKKISFFSVFFILLSVLAFGYRSVFRPEIFSYLLLCIFLYFLEKEKRLYLLPFLQVIWVNLHGYFILGPILVFIYFLGNKTRRSAFIFIAVILACFVNPYFYKGALYPATVLMDVFSGQKLCMQNVHELMMPIRSSFGKLIFFWLLAIMASATFIVNLKNAKLKHAALFAFSFLASYIALRNIPIFIFIGMPLAIMNLDSSGLAKKISEKKYYIVYILLTSGLLYFFLSDGYYKYIGQYPLRKTESGFSRLFMPSGACDFLKDNKIEGPMFNTLDFGPYIGYRFYPEKRIFMDTRTDLYKDDFYLIYTKAQNYPEEWQGIYKKYGFQTVLLRHLFSGTEKILRYLYRHEGWRLVYYDENSCVFLSNIPQNSEVIKRFWIDLGRKKLEISDININIARFFDKIGEPDLAEKVYIELLKKNPGFLEAGNNLATIYISTGRVEAGAGLIRKFLRQYPHAAELYANLGAAYLSLGRRDQGLALLEKTARMDPYYRKASYLLGIVYLERGEIDRAMRQFIKYINLDPYNAEVHRFLGDIYTQKGLLEKARSEYNEGYALEGIK